MPIGTVKQLSQIVGTWLMLTLMTGFSLPCQAQIKLGNGKGIAYTRVPKSDPSFPLMGEFVGKIEDGTSQSMLGLQVRSIGKDQFSAIAYMGGLPGQPGFQSEPIPMEGRRSGDFVVLTGGPWAVFVEKKTCRIVDRTGKTIAQLKRLRRTSPTMHAPAPEGSVVIFDGTHVDQFTGGRMTRDGLLKEGARLKPMFQDFDLHIEFMLPYMPEADGQKRGNSGLYLQSRYECQILDSFGTEPLINGCGALYRFKAPDLNMSLPPLSWQTYDVSFTAPRWSSEGTKIRNATISSWLNGTKVQDNVSLPNKTGAGKVEEPTLLPTLFQDHGDPVRFRNAWIVDRGLTEAAEFPIMTTKDQRVAAVKRYQTIKKRRMMANKKKREEAIKEAIKQVDQQLRQEREEADKD